MDIQWYLYCKTTTFTIPDKFVAKKKNTNDALGSLSTDQLLLAASYARAASAASYHDYRLSIFHTIIDCQCVAVAAAASAATGATPSATYFDFNLLSIFFFFPPKHQENVKIDNELVTTLINRRDSNMNVFTRADSSRTSAIDHWSWLDGNFQDYSGHVTV